MSNQPGQNQRVQPSQKEIQAAKEIPNGWVYKIDTHYGGDGSGAVPPEAMVGAWKVDGSGRIVGEFTPNPNYPRNYSPTQ
jgi:hypothetical protein